MDKNKVICRCINVTYGQIEDAIKSGCSTFEQVQAKTKCSTGCGCCAEDVKNIINSLK